MTLNNEMLKEYCKNENDKIKEIKSIMNEILINLKQKKTILAYANLNQLYSLIKSDFIIKSTIFQDEPETTEQGITIILRKIIVNLGFPEWFVELKKDSELIKILSQFIQTQKTEIKLNNFISTIETQSTDEYEKVNSSTIVSIYCIINDLKRESNNKDTVAIINELNKLFNILSKELPNELDNKPTIDIFKPMTKSQPFADQMNNRLDSLLRLLEGDFNFNDSPTIKVNKLIECLIKRYPIENNYWTIRK